jgi:hypothetical protein
MVWKSVVNLVEQLSQSIYTFEVSNHVCRKLLGSVNKGNKSEGKNKYGKRILHCMSGKEYSQEKKKWYQVLSSNGIAELLFGMRGYLC